MVGETNWLAPVRWTGDGLTIRVYSIEDAEELSRAVNESYEHLKPWMPWANMNQTVIQSEQISRRLIASYHDNSDYTMGIWDGDTLIGGTGFHLRCGPIEWKAAEIGMWIRSSYAGKGWGTRSLEQMLTWGFEVWGWERLTWKCDTRNEGSIRVAEKCGLTREATFLSDALDVEAKRRDSHQYVMLKANWSKR